MHLFKTSEKYFKVDPWLVIEEGFDPAKQRLSESIFSLANEFMCIRGYFEEGYSGDHLLGSYFSQLYDMMDINYPQVFKGFITEGATMINAVDWLYTRINLDGEELDLAKVKFSDFKRTLDMKNAVLSREFMWTTVGGKKFKITFQRFTDIVNTSIGFQRVSFEPLNFSGEVKITSGLDFDTIYELAAGWDQTRGTGSSSDKKNDLNFWTCEKKEKIGDVFAIQARTRKSGISLFSGFRLSSDQKLDLKILEGEKFIGAEFNLKLKQNQTSSFDKIAVNHWQQSEDIKKVWSEGMKLTEKYSALTYKKAFEKHKSAWADYWYRMDVEIDGDPELLQGIRYSLYVMFINYHGESEHRNVICKLGGEVYNGVNFWDTEIYCHRMFLFLNPEIARKLLMYRYHHLPKAMENAKRMGLEGARYAFSTITGAEEMGTWQHVDLEIHQNEAVFYAIWHYDKVCGDKKFLYNEGIEMLLEMCRCMASLGGWSPKNGDFGFYGVMGPDEFHMMVNHNCYTNYMGKKMFLYTLDVLDKMKKDEPSLYQKVVDKVKLRPEEPKEWQHMADKMRILKDEKTGIYEQHDGYFDLPHIDVKSIPMSQVPIYTHWAYIKIFRFNMTKQPDFLNLPFFFSRDFTMKEKKDNYEFYEARTSHESSLSPSLHAVLAAELGKMEEAYQFLSYASRLDLDNYNRNTEQGIHSSSAFGVWASVVSGFGGLRTDSDTLIFNPSIPEQWKSYSFKIAYQGALLSVIVTQEKVVFKLETGSPVKIEIFGKTEEITDKELILKLTK